MYDFSTGINLTSFNVTINGTTKATTNGTIHFNLTSNNYTALYEAPLYADKYENVTVIGYTVINSSMYKINSILVYVFDEDTGLMINNSEILFDANTTYYQEFTTTNGSVYVTGIPSVYYDIRARATDYVDRHYYVTLSNNYYILNAYLLNNSNAVVLSIKSEATDKFIEGAVVTLNRRINGTWSNVGSGTTDGVGSLRFGMKEGETYSLLISASGYETKQLSLTPFESAYTIYIQKTNLQTFYRLFDKLSFRIMPSVSVIPPYSYANPITCFNLTVVSPEGWVEWFSVNSSFNGVVNISNLTTATGGIAQFCLNLSSYNGYNLSVDYWIKTTGESLWYGHTTYWINNRSYGSITEWLNVSDYSIVGVLENYKDEIPATWKIIDILVVAIGLMLTFARWIPPEALGFIGVTVIGVMGWYWFNEWFKAIGVILILAFAILFLLRSRGGE